MTHDDAQDAAIPASCLPITRHDPACNDGGLFALVVLVDSIQEYADEQGLLFDDEDRDRIDRAVRALIKILDAWGNLTARIPRRSVDWRVRLTEARRPDEDVAAGAGV